ncbi:hypothetical protein L208DRAFT_120296 [Tricholoma matsutake]|nr:hypothetical protein L208DRAFT_120296 [Tricholoma matsutake 945]
MVRGRGQTEQAGTTTQGKSTAMPRPTLSRSWRDGFFLFKYCTICIKLFNQ